MGTSAVFRLIVRSFSARSLALALCILGFALIAGNARAEVTTLTPEQVSAVCGKDSKKSDTGGFGCQKACANKKDTCTYYCSKSGDCSGISIAVSPKASKGDPKPTVPPKPTTVGTTGPLGGALTTGPKTKPKHPEVGKLGAGVAP